MKQTPLYQAYAAIARRPEDSPMRQTKMGELLKQDYPTRADSQGVWIETCGGRSRLIALARGACVRFGPAPSR